MKKLTLTLLCCVMVVSLKALPFVDLENSANKIIESVLANPKVDKAIKTIEAQYNAIIADYNRVNAELTAAIEQVKQVEKRIERITLYVSIAILLVCIGLPVLGGFFLYRRIKKSKIFRMGENLSLLKDEIAKLNSRMQVSS